MIKQLKQVNNIEEANKLLDKGWILLSSNNSTFILGAKEEVGEKATNIKKETGNPFEGMCFKYPPVSKECFIKSYDDYVRRCSF